MTPSALHLWHIPTPDPSVHQQDREPSGLRATKVPFFPRVRRAPAPNASLRQKEPEEIRDGAGGKDFRPRFKETSLSDQGRGCETGNPPAQAAHASISPHPIISAGGTLLQHPTALFSTADCARFLLPLRKVSLQGGGKKKGIKKNKIGS